MKAIRFETTDEGVWDTGDEHTHLVGCEENAFEALCGVMGVNCRKVIVDVALEEVDCPRCCRAVRSLLDHYTVDELTRLGNTR